MLVTVSSCLFTLRCTIYISHLNNAQRSNLMAVQEIKAEVFTTVPTEFLNAGKESSWGTANRPGDDVPSFLEGPSFDKNGHLWLVDIPWGRIFSISPDGNWTIRAQCDGWPNGLRIHPDASVWVADYRRGIVKINPATGDIQYIFATKRSEGFKGCNDLFFGADGTLYFTDQGQTGLHDPTGAVYRVPSDTSRLERLIGNGPSPNGLVTNIDETALYVAMTRACEVWRVPLYPEGPTKVGLFARLPAGVGGPDGMALDEAGNLYVCHVSKGRIFAYDPHGDDFLTIDCSHIGRAVTNLAFGGDDQRDLFITVSDANTVARARMPVPGRPMYSHA